MSSVASIATVRLPIRGRYLPSFPWFENRVFFAKPGAWRAVAGAAPERARQSIGWLKNCLPGLLAALLLTWLPAWAGSEVTTTTHAFPSPGDTATTVAPDNATLWAIEKAAQSIPFANRGTQMLGSASERQTATLLFTVSGTLKAIAVVTQGAPGLDFQAASGGTCATDTAYSVGQSCTVSYTFNPLHPGLRLGGITLTDPTGKVLGMTYLTGTGVGPQAAFADTTSGVYLPSAQGILGSGFSHPAGVAVDGSGNVFVADLANHAVKEIVAAGGYTTVKPWAADSETPMAWRWTGSAMYSSPIPPTTP